jgi:hypothetical protein
MLRHPKKSRAVAAEPQSLPERRLGARLGANLRATEMSPDADV